MCDQLQADAMTSLLEGDFGPGVQPADICVINLCYFLIELQAVRRQYQALGAAVWSSCSEDLLIRAAGSSPPSHRRNGTGLSCLVLVSR